MSAPKQTTPSSNNSASSTKTQYVAVPKDLTEKMSHKVWPGYRATFVAFLKATAKYEDKTHSQHGANFKGELSAKEVIDNVMEPLLKIPKDLNTINAVEQIKKQYGYDALNQCGVAR